MINLQRPSDFVVHFWTQRQQERAFTQAIHAIYPRWAARNRQWANAFFDEHFLRQRAAPLLAQYQLGKPGTEASKLANQWADQFRFNAVRRQQLVDELTPVGGQFSLSAQGGIERMRSTNAQWWLGCAAERMDGSIKR